MSSVGITSTQLQVARRVEEVRAQPVPAELGAAALGDRRDRNARRVRRDDGAGPADGFDALEQRALDVELFDDGLEDPVHAVQTGEVGVEPAGGDERRGVGREERIRLEAARAFEAVARDLAR